jgi:DnaJ-class molecular chaperone
LLGKIQDDLDKDSGAAPADGAVMETYYYDVLEISPQADPSAIKRRYYVLARKYHPDKVDKDDTEAHDKFKDIAEAYQVLSDPELRVNYDKNGRAGLSADKTSAAEEAAKVDAATLFAFLFGSDKFHDYVGRLAVATSASIGDSPKVTLAVGKQLQSRRVLRLALTLAAKLDKWVEGDFDYCKTLWATEAAALASASYGLQLIHLLGKVR